MPCSWDSVRDMLRDRLRNIVWLGPGWAAEGRARGGKVTPWPRCGRCPALEIDPHRPVGRTRSDPHERCAGDTLDSV